MPRSPATSVGLQRHSRVRVKHSVCCRDTYHTKIFIRNTAAAPSHWKDAFTSHATMIAATRRWFRRNRTNLAIGAGVIGAGYVAGQYVLGKISEARQRMSEDRIAKEK